MEPHGTGTTTRARSSSLVGSHLPPLNLSGRDRGDNLPRDRERERAERAERGPPPATPRGSQLPTTPLLKTPRSPAPTPPGIPTPLAYSESKLGGLTTPHSASHGGQHGSQAPRSRISHLAQTVGPTLHQLCGKLVSALPSVSLPHRRRRIFSARSLVLLCLLFGVLVLAWVGERAREGRWRSEIDRRGNEWREFVRTVPPYNEHLFPTKRGIVYTASKSDLPLAIVSIIMLRTLGCQLPIEIVHFRGELGDKEKEWITKIPGGGVVLRDVESMVAEIGKRYWQGAAALNNSTTSSSSSAGAANQFTSASQMAAHQLGVAGVMEGDPAADPALQAETDPADGMMGPGDDPSLDQHPHPAAGLGGGTDDSQQHPIGISPYGATNPSTPSTATGPIWFPHLPVKWDRNPRGTNPGRNYQLKAAAVLFSSFEEVLYLDSDNFPVMDPSFLFEHASFREGMVEVDDPSGQRIEVPVSGVFWPDYRPIDADNPIFRTLGLPRGSWARNEKAQEAGQLLLSKPRCWKALNLALYMASDSSLPLRGGRPFYYLLLHGDKDTFRFAWRATGTGFYGVGNEGRAYVLPAGDLWSDVEHDWWGATWARRRLPRNSTVTAHDGAQVLVDELAVNFCGHTMVQAHPSAPSIPLFFHTNEVKYHATGPQSSLAALSARLHPSGRRWTYYQRYVYRDPRTGLVSSMIPKELLKRTRDKDTHWLRGFPSWSCRTLQPDPKVGLEVQTVRVEDKEGGVNDIWRKGVQGLLEVVGGEQEIGIVGKGKPQKEEKSEQDVGMRTRRWGWSRWMFGDGV